MEYYLNKLINDINDMNGKKLINITRAANMVCFSFGENIVTHNYRGEMVLKSEFAIHLQCPWRVIGKEKVEFAFSDIFLPINNVTLKQQFDWDKKGSNMFDYKSNKWLKMQSAISIHNIKLNSFGDMKLQFSDDYTLEVFIDCSAQEECWRLIRQTQDTSKHFVITGTSIELED